MGNIYKIKHNKRGTHEDWTKQRLSIEGIDSLTDVRIGASDVSVITNTNKWKCPQRLFYHLTGYHHSFFITEETLAGHLMEPITAARYESFVIDDELTSLNNSLQGIKERKVKKADFFLLNKKYPNSFISLDYIHVGKVHSPFTGELYSPLTPIELKHSNISFYKNWVDGIAQQYMEQVQYQMLLTETKVAVFLVLLDGKSFKAKEIYADPNLQAYILEKVNEFAEKVKIGKVALNGMKEAKLAGNIEEFESFYEIFERVTPDPVGMSDNVELMQEIYSDPIDGDAVIKKGDDCDDYNLSQYLKCIKVTNNIENYKKLLKTKILKSCAEYEGLKTDSHKCTNRRATKFKRAYFSVDPIK